VAVFLKGYFGTKKKVGFKQSKPKMRVLAKQYREFPQVNFPHVLIDNTRELLIAFLVVGFFDKAIFGSYDHSFRMLKLPLVLVGASIGQVFYNRCSLMFFQKEAIYPLLKKRHTPLQRSQLFHLVSFSFSVRNYSLLCLGCIGTFPVEFQKLSRRGFWLIL
jgi:hypothetical protein